jgi:hypothetical protein
MVGDPPYSPAVPDDLEDSPPPASAPVPEPAWPAVATSAPPEFVQPEEIDIAGDVAAQEQVDAAAESLLLAHLGGLLSVLLAIAVASTLVALTGWWHRAALLVPAFAVALAVKQCGHGSDRRFGFAGAWWALAGCFLAHQLAMAGVFAHLERMPLLDYLRGVHNWSEWLAEVMRWPDLLFYGIATFCGYKFSFDSVPGKQGGCTHDSPCC